MTKYFMILFLLFIVNCSWIWAGLTKPPDGSELTYIHVLFEWEEIEDASVYDFPLSSTNDFIIHLVNTIITNHKTDANTS